MSQIEIIKAKVAPADAARQYGLTVHRNGMALCPFHNDTNPSMKLYDDHFYCFACVAHGDVIDLSAKLLGLSFTEVIHRIAVDFGIDPDKPPTLMPVRPYLAQFRKDETLCISVLTEYEQLLVYFLLRHLLADEGRALPARAAFAVLSTAMLYALGAAVRTENGTVSFGERVELARLWSANVEYSEENMRAALDELT